MNVSLSLSINRHSNNSATEVIQEVNNVVTMAGRKKPMAVVTLGPMLNNTKICTLKRPSSQVPVLGEDDAKGREVPGLLHLLQRLVLDNFVKAVSDGPPYDQFKKTIIFFRNSYHMCEINGWLISQLGSGRYDTSLFCMNHSSVSKSGQAIMQARIGSYLLILTTSRMLLGLDVPGLQQVILVTVVNKVYRSWGHLFCNICKKGTKAHRNNVCIFSWSREIFQLVSISMTTRSSSGSLIGVYFIFIHHLSVRPPDTLHAIVQAGGRAGRLLHSGEREATVTYVLYNDQGSGLERPIFATDI